MCVESNPAQLCKDPCCQPVGEIRAVCTNTRTHACNNQTWEINGNQERKLMSRRALTHMYMNTHVCTYLPGTNQGSLVSLTTFTSPCTSQTAFPPSHLIFSGCCSYYSCFFLAMALLKSHITASAIHGPLAYDSLKDHYCSSPKKRIVYRAQQ